MRILSLQLENIKSYHEPTRIEFTDGLNAVCGLNGAGKTTLLESIGFALFDFLPYNHAAFVREGEKSGTIRLRLLAGDDREYEIFRRVGARSAWQVIDRETGTTLADRGENVKLWIAAHLLNVEGEIDLGSLFQNAVGVPQGAMTSDFVRSGTSRKAIFDPLLRVEEYQTAWETLRETVRYVQDGSSDLRAAISGLEGETARLAEVRERASGLDGELTQRKAELQRLAAELVALEAQLTELDRSEITLKTLSETLLHAESDHRVAANAVEVSEGAWRSARAAHGAVEAAQEGYRLYLEAAEASRALNGRRDERDGLRASLANVRGDLDATSRTISNLERELLTAERDARAAKDLEPQVARQTELETILAKDAHRLDSLPQLLADISRVDADIDAVRADHTALEARIQRARAAAKDASAGDVIAGELRAVEIQLAKVEQLKLQQREVESNGKRLREQFDEWNGHAERAATLQSRLSALASHADRVEGITAQFEELRERYLRVTATIEYQDVAQASLGSGRCPLLNLECPVVTSDGGTLTRLQREARLMGAERASVEHAIAELEPQLAHARRAADERRTVQLELAAVAGAPARRDELQSELASFRARYASLRDEIAEGIALEQKRTELSQEVARLQSLHALAVSLPALEEQYAAGAKSLAALQASRTTLEGRRSELEALQHDVASLRAQLDGLGDPRTVQQRLEAAARRSTLLRAELTSERSRREKATLSFNELKEGLQAFETLDAEIAVQLENEGTHRPAYEAYLQNLTEAQSLAQREAAVEEAKRVLEESREQVVALRAEVSDARASYDGERHQQLKGEHDNLRIETARVQSATDRARIDLAGVQRDLHDLQRKVEQLEQRRREQKDLEAVQRAVNFIRDTIRAAGPVVTEMLLASISQGANDIFAEIMDDHTSELRWDRDYEVLVQRGAETRKFAQLSGGEQMSAALAVRLALLREMSEVDFAFFDEPTQNMDAGRRTNLADQIGQIKGFEQLIVISHDDTFEHHTDNLIRLAKDHEETRVESV